MATETLAESIEKARFELMRGQRWTDLRASERETRVDLARRALDESGVTAELDRLGRQADRVPDLEALVARQDAEITTLEARVAADRAAHEARVESDRVAHEARVADLEAQLSTVRRERDRAEARLAATESVLDAVRTLVTTPVEVASDDVAESPGPSPVAEVPHPATDGSAHTRRPIFRMARSAPAT